ncbi:MAG: hypothetical protein ACRD26_10455 [Vicinamibacterales bacterium]
MQTYFELLDRLGQSRSDQAQPAEVGSGLRKVVAAGVHLLQVILTDGDHGALRRFAIETAQASQRLGTPTLEQVDEPQLLACLALLTRLSLRLNEQLAPQRAAERLLGRSPLAKRVLREIAVRDHVRAAVLRRELEPQLSTVLTQANLSRVVKRLAAAGWVSIDRSPDGVPWYGITLRGRAAARELFGEVVAARRPEPPGPMRLQRDGDLIRHYEAVGADYCLPRGASR